jgi:hypothetical protein
MRINQRLTIFHSSSGFTRQSINSPTPAQKYVKRLVGEPKDVSPPISKKLENRAHRWMVAVEWLNKPKTKTETPSRISESGVAWGDEKDEIEAMQKRVKGEKEDIKRKEAKGEAGKDKKRTRVVHM